MKVSLSDLAPNGSRYPLVGGTKERHFTGTNLKPRKLSENAQTPTSRENAVLGGGYPLLPSISSHRQRNPDGFPSENGATLGLVLAVFLVGFPLHLFETGVVISKLVEMSESDFAGDERIVARHVC